MADIDAFLFWANNPDFRLFKEEDPNTPAWCAESLPLIEWGEGLCKQVSLHQKGEGESAAKDRIRI